MAGVPEVKMLYGYQKMCLISRSANDGSVTQIWTDYSELNGVISFYMCITYYLYLNENQLLLR